MLEVALDLCAVGLLGRLAQARHVRAQGGDAASGARVVAVSSDR